MRESRPDPARSRVASTRWIDRWLDACSELAELERSNPMTDAVIDEIDGRMIRIGDKRLADFASCNYLGLDLDREIIAAVPEYLEEGWGTHPSWSRMLGSPVLYEQIEERLVALLGCQDALVLPTITPSTLRLSRSSQRTGRYSSTTAHTRRSTTVASLRRLAVQRSSDSASRTLTTSSSFFVRIAPPRGWSAWTG